MKRVVAIIGTMLLLMTVAAFAQVSKAKVATGSAVGTITSIDENKLVLSHKVKGKDESTTFVLNADTKKVGDLVPGAKVTVHYKVENNQNIATMVRASGPAKKK